MVLFEDLLSAQDLREAANALVREFREQHDLPPIHQLGLVVADVQLAAQTLEARGMGPFFITHGAASMWREHGEEHHFRGKMGLAYHRGFELELLQPGEGSNFYRQSLDTVGRIVVQHLGFSVMDVDAWANRLTASSGYPIWVRGRLQTARCAWTSPTWTPPNRPALSSSSSPGASLAWCSAHRLRSCTASVACRNGLAKGVCLCRRKRVDAANTLTP
jgi:hypothetical protein